MIDFVIEYDSINTQKNKTAGNALNNFFITQENGGKLQKKLLAYYTNLSKTAPSQVADSLRISISEIKNPEFCSLHFHSIALIQATIVLNKFKNDVFNNELQTLRVYLKTKHNSI